MAFTVKIRTLPGSPMMAEYECEDHGRFELLVARDANGDPPAEVECRCVVYIDGASVTDIYDPGTVEMPFPCSEKATLCISAPSIKFWSRAPVPIGRASKSDEKDPRALDTEPLATGKMNRKEWDKYQRGITQERRYQRRLKAGRISKRIQVGGG